MLLRLGLEIADRMVNALPGRVVYGLADLAGDAWRRLSPARRRLVAANLARICAATDRPTSGPAFAALVRAAFRHHARYYAEILRTPHYDSDRLGQVVTIRDWERYEPILRSGGSVIVSAHLGNFEPFAMHLAALGMSVAAPVEEIRPRELFEFLAARRGGGALQLVPLRSSRTVLSRHLRSGGIVGILADRVIGGSGGHPVTMFGHPTRIPNGPATLALTHGAALIVGRVLRDGPDHFMAEGEILDIPEGLERREAVAALTERIASRFEHDIGAAPEQWWGAFQPFWPDLPA